MLSFFPRDVLDEIWDLIESVSEVFLPTLMCLSIGTPKAINFPLVSNEKLMFLGVPIFKHITMRL